MRFRVRAGALLAVPVLFSACAYTPVFAVRDRETAARVKKVAVMPFFDAQLLTAFDPEYTGWGSSFIPAMQFDKLAKETLSSRFEIVDQKSSLGALIAAGAEYKHVKGAWSAVKDPEGIRWGYTLAQALAAGKALGVDAVLMGAQGQYLGDNKKFQAVALRLVEVPNGKVLWGINVTGQPNAFSKTAVVRKLLSRVAREAP